MTGNPPRLRRRMLRFLDNPRLIWLPVPLLLAVMAVLRAADLRTSYESPHLLMTLNFFCTTLTSVLVVVMIGKSFIRSGAPGLLMLGCGVLSWGIAATSGVAVLGHGINATVTVHNTLAWLAALCHLSGVALSQKRYRNVRLPASALAIAYAAILIAAGLLDVLAMEKLTPLFFMQNRGGTPIRQFVLGSAIVMFGFSAAMLWWMNRPSPSNFVRWYACALLLVAIGLLGVMAQSVFGGALSWTGRAAQYLGGIYMLLAAGAAVRETGMEGLSLSAAMREAQQNFRTLVDMSPDAIAVHAGGKYVFVNPAAVHLFGAKGPEELVGREVLSLVPPEDREAVAARMRRALEHGRTALVRQFRVLRLDGRPVEVETAGARIEFQGQAAVQLVLRDITEIKKAEAALQESELRFRTMANAMPQLAWIARADGHIIWYNQRWYDYTGTVPEQMEGWGWQSVHDPKVLPKVLARWRSSIATGEPFNMTFPLRGADGVFRPFLTLVIPLKDAAGSVQQWFGSNTDISRLKHIEERLKASLAEKEVLLKEVHHRVKNNLQVISSLVSLQADTLADARVLEVLGDVRNRVMTMALVHEKLYQTDDLAQLNFTEYAEGILRHLWNAYSAETRNIHLNLSFAPMVMPVETAVPCGLILNELVSNAIKHAFPGISGGEVSVTLEHDPATGTSCLRVRDNGAGLPADLDWRQSGSLGLRLVQMLAGQMHGVVQAVSGSGTEFQITFHP